MTVNMQVLRSLAPNGFGTNREISRNIERPEPTVRRATRELVELGMLKQDGMWAGQRDYVLTPRGKTAARLGRI